MTLIIIDDNFNLDEEPTIEELNDQIPSLDIRNIKTGQDFLEEIKENKIDFSTSIILLDLSFGNGRMQGIDILRKLRTISNITPVIIFTAADDPSNQIPEFINLDTAAYLKKTASTKEIIAAVKRSIHALETNVSGALSQWIEAHPEEERKKPYLTLADGKSYNLNQILEELSKDSEIGKEFREKLLRLTIDLIARNKEKL